MVQPLHPGDRGLSTTVATAAGLSAMERPAAGIRAGSPLRRLLGPLLAAPVTVWLLLAWCELRQDFRSFRVDRIHGILFGEERYPPTPGRRLIDYLKKHNAEILA